MKKSKECVCADGYENQDGACADIDECALADSCGENEVRVYCLFIQFQCGRVTSAVIIGDISSDDTLKW